MLAHPGKREEEGRKRKGRKKTIFEVNVQNGTQGRDEETHVLL